MHYLALLHLVGQPGTPAEPFALALFWDLARLDSALLQSGCGANENMQRSSVKAPSLAASACDTPRELFHKAKHPGNNQEEELGYVCQHRAVNRSSCALQSLLPYNLPLLLTGMWLIRNMLLCYIHLLVRTSVNWV